jgi:hypothetical protein
MAKLASRNLVQRIWWRWNQPANEGNRILVGIALCLTAITVILWVEAALISSLFH